VHAAGYPSHVRSTPGDSIDQIITAIDQLASDVEADSGRAQHASSQHAARIADIWRMVTSLDPDLARRVSGYTTLAGAADDANPS
jgi:hypothetical protein